MSKKCDFCGNRIVVDQGDYVNYYPAADKSNPIAWKMESYHFRCFQEKIVVNSGTKEEA
jgi:hypothetical protein